MGPLISYFLKVLVGDDGKGIMCRKFESIKALHETLPDLVPKPISWGT